MTITGISDNVQALLTGMSEGEESVFVTVLSAPPTEGENFAGYPSVCHYYANTQSDYATVSQNRRIIEHRVELYISADKDTTVEDAEKEAYALIDKVIQMFDESIDLSSTALSLARACDLMRPTPGELDRYTGPEGAAFMMTITLFCSADISFQ